jgi:hypothetical protein
MCKYSQEGKHHFAAPVLYLLTPWSRFLLEKLTGSQLVKKSPAFYGSRRFVTFHLILLDLITRIIFGDLCYETLNYWSSI